MTVKVGSQKLQKSLISDDLSTFQESQFFMKIEDLKKSEKHEKSGLACNCPESPDSLATPLFKKNPKMTKKWKKHKNRENVENIDNWLSIEEKSGIACHWAGFIGLLVGLQKISEKTSRCSSHRGKTACQPQKQHSEAKPQNRPQQQQWPHRAH